MKTFEYWRGNWGTTADKAQPCAMEAAEKRAREAGHKGPLALLLVCRCPKCNKVTC